MKACRRKEILAFSAPDGQWQCDQTVPSGPAGAVPRHGALGAGGGCVGSDGNLDDNYPLVGGVRHEGDTA